MFLIRVLAVVLGKSIVHVTWRTTTRGWIWVYGHLVLLSLVVIHVVCGVGNLNEVFIGLPQ